MYLGEMEVDTLFRRIKLCRLRWLGHVLRMETSLPTTSGPVFNATDRVEEATRRPTDDVAT